MDKSDFNEVKEYNLQGVPVWQHELTIGQDIKLAELVSKLGDVDWKNLKAVLSALQKDALLGDFLEVILEGEVSKIDPLKITNSQVSEVAQDFFELNGTGIESFKSLFNRVVSIPEVPEERTES